MSCGHEAHCFDSNNEWHSHENEPDVCLACHPELADPNVRDLYSQVAGDTGSGHAPAGAA